MTLSGSEDISEVNAVLTKQPAAEGPLALVGVSKSKESSNLLSIRVLHGADVLDTERWLGRAAGPAAKQGMVRACT